MNEQRPRIVFLLSGYGVVNRGAERFLQELLCRLRDSFDMVVLSAASSAMSGVVRIKVVSRDNSLVTFLNRLPVVGHAMRVADLSPLCIEWLTGSISSMRWLMKNEFDLFVPEAGAWGARLGRYIRRKKGVPFVDVGHGAVGRWEIAAGRCMPDRYVAATQESYGRITKAVPGIRASVIPMGVDTSVFCPEGEARPLQVERPIFLCASAVESMKRVHLAVEAVARLPKGSLVVAGDGPLSGRIDELALRLLGKERYWRTALPFAEMPALYRACDAVTLPSSSEAFPLTCLEAMGCNKPVVVHNDGVRREIVGEGGVLCDCTDTSAYARSLSSAVEKDWGETPRRQAVLYDWSSVAAMYKKLFFDLITANNQ
jgi:glycosyltransferase involved in cell wall biosynthesis